MLRDNLPPEVTNVREMDILLSAEQPEIDRLERDCDSMLDEFRVDKTNKLVHLWEDFLGFPRKPAWPIDRRRERLKARLYSSGQLTIARLKEIIEHVGGVEVRLEELYDDCIIIVHFVGEIGVPKYLDDIKQEIELIRPFHIVFEWLFKYRTNRELSQYTHGQLSGYAHDQLRNEVLN